MSQYLLAIDQGTTSSRAILFTLEGRIHAVEQQEFAQIYPDSGWVEHDPEAIWDTVRATCQAVLDNSGVDASQIAGVGITNQRETTVLWDRKTGKPVYNAIVWQDRRTAGFCQQLKDDGHEPGVTERSGLIIDPYFSATKIRWILENVEGARDRAERGELAFGTIDTFLLWRFTEGRSFLTDATNASRTMLFNIHEQRWDPDLLKLFDVPESLLPEVRDCASDFGTIADGLPAAGATIGGIAGDQQAALFGQTCFAEGTAKSTYGTGCFLILNTGEQALKSEHRLLTTVGYRLDGKTTYALEGSIFIAGAAIQWLRDGLSLIRMADECEMLAEQTPVDHGVYLVPAFTGLGAPTGTPRPAGPCSG